MNPYSHRWERCRSQFSAAQLSALWVQDPINLSYLTGMTLSAGIFILTRDSAYLFLDPRYYDAGVAQAPCKILPWNNDAIFSIWKEITQKQSHSMGVDSCTITYQEYLTLQELLHTFIRLHNEEEFLLLLPCRDILAELRSIKDAEEWKKMEEAAAAGWQGYEKVLTLLKTGISEAEVAQKLKLFYLEQFASTPSFEPIIAFGENTALPHHRASTRRLQPNELVLIDIGVCLNGYCSDLSRTVAWGKISEELYTYYQVVADAQQAGLDYCRPGITGEQLDQHVRQVIEKAGYEYAFVHGLGHGVGVEIHEFPSINQKAPSGKISLQAGMVITIEPGIYFPGKGGIRIEDMVILTESGCYNPTPADKQPMRHLPA